MSKLMAKANFLRHLVGGVADETVVGRQRFLKQMHYGREFHLFVLQRLHQVVWSIGRFFFFDFVLLLLFRFDEFFF